MDLIYSGNSQYPTFNSPDLNKRKHPYPLIEKKLKEKEILTFTSKPYPVDPAGDSTRISFSTENLNHPDPLALRIKRGFDIISGFIGAMAFILAYPILGLMIKIESPGPILYRQNRVGIDKRKGRGALETGERNSRRTQDVGGALFSLSKFRTMRIDAEAHGPQLCIKGHDPRVTRMGRLLRATHLDELPQFWNVLKGEMSLIGPRPERPHFTLKYFDQIPLYRDRTRHIKPGLTGLSQITLGYDDSLESVKRKTHLDLTYNASVHRLGSCIKMELWILVNTLRYLLTRKPLNKIHPDPLPKNIFLKESSPIFTKPISSPITPQNFMTIDVESWFHAHNLGIEKNQWQSLPCRIEANMQTILDLLAKHQTKATFFVLGWIADRYPDLVRAIDEAGHEIGSHGYMHDKVTDLTPYQFELDLDHSLTALTKRTHQNIIGYRASNFSIVESTYWALDILAQYGIEYDSSIFPVATKRYGIAQYPHHQPHTIHLNQGRTICEVPLSTFKFAGKSLPIAGGGYLRLYPYALTDLFLRQQKKKNQSAMVYFHPWELDILQERRKVGWKNSFQHYVNLNTTEKKIDTMLGRYAFGSVREILESPKMQEVLERDRIDLGSRIIDSTYPDKSPKNSEASPSQVTNNLSRALVQATRMVV